MIQQLRQDWFLKGYSSCFNPRSIDPDDYGRVYSDDGMIHYRNLGNREAIEQASLRPALAWAASILVSKEKKSCISVAVKKCSCGSVWCLNCFRRKRAQELASRMQGMKWERVRLVTLTIDRTLYVDGQQAYEDIKANKRLVQFIHNLKRTAGIRVIDWMWFLEWSRDGFPHYHFVIEVEEKGRAGMIGQEHIHHYWPLGRIQEKFVTNENHWKNLSGYFGKHGYFADKQEGKASQGQLPEWALDYRHKIRRSGSMRLSSGAGDYSSDGEGVSSRDEADQRRTVIKKERKPYSLILVKCGSKVMLDVFTSQSMFSSIILNVSYNDILKENPGGVFKAGMGYCIDVEESEFLEFVDRYSDRSEPMKLIQAQSHLHHNQNIWREDRFLERPVRYAEDCQVG